MRVALQFSAKVIHVGQLQILKLPTQLDSILFQGKKNENEQICITKWQILKRKYLGMNRSIIISSLGKKQSHRDQ